MSRWLVIFLNSHVELQGYYFMFNLSHFQQEDSFEDVVAVLQKTESDIMSQVSRRFLHTSNSLWRWLISQSDSNDCNWTGTVSSHSVLSITLDAICCFCACVSPPFSPLWQPTDVLVTMSEGGRVRVSLWDYEKLSACSPAWVHCEDVARKRCVGGMAWGGHHSSPPTTLCLMRGVGGF